MPYAFGIPLYAFHFMLSAFGILLYTFSVLFHNFIYLVFKLIALQKIFRRYFELACWSGALVSLAFMDPSASTHYSLCFFKYIGLPFCPGCGLGHSISYLFHGQLRASFQAHPLGLFAVVILLFRIYKLSLLNFSKTKLNYYAI
jgi:Protein of unknown function (DUF2752)